MGRLEIHGTGMALEWKKNSWKRYHVCIQGATSTTYNILYYMHVCDCMCMHLCTININEKTGTSSMTSSPNGNQLAPMRGMQ
jgi:hypothetical protein